MLENLSQEAVLLSDEPDFNLSGSVNKENFPCWCADNTKEIHEKPLRSDKVTVYCDVSEMGIIGSYFFKEGNRGVTGNSERYIAMIQNFFGPYVVKRNVPIAWFKQEGARAHTS